jgi:transcriptional regulator with XRE-family HTH domain
MSLDKYAAMIQEAEQSVDYWKDIALTDFARDLHERMRAQKISSAELARRMGTSKSYVSQMLDGGNFTLQTMVKVAMALDAVVRIHLEGKEERAAAAESSGVVVDLAQHRAFTEGSPSLPAAGTAPEESPGSGTAVRSPSRSRRAR